MSSRISLTRDATRPSMTPLSALVNSVSRRARVTSSWRAVSSAAASSSSARSGAVRRSVQAIISTPRRRGGFRSRSSTTGCHGASAGPDSSRTSTYCARERMVALRLAGESVSSSSRLRGGGSSSVFSRAPWALSFNRSANKITPAFQPPA